MSSYHNLYHYLLMFISSYCIFVFGNTVGGIIMSFIINSISFNFIQNFLQIEDKYIIHNPIYYKSNHT